MSPKSAKKDGTKVNSIKSGSPLIRKEKLAESAFFWVSRSVQMTWKVSKWTRLSGNFLFSNYYKNQCKKLVNPLLSRIVTKSFYVFFT